MIRIGIVKSRVLVSKAKRISVWPLWLTLAAVILIPSASRADDTAAGMDDSTAMAIPSLGGYHGLAPVLLPSEAARMRKIFELQRAGKSSQAADQTARLQDDTLLGEILADRYLHSGEPVSSSDLAAWLDRSRDHPEAEQIRELLFTIDPGSSGSTQDIPLSQSQSYGAGSRLQFDAGLAAWRLGDYAGAAARFQAAWLAESSDQARRSADAFWAARALLRGEDVPSYLDWMTRAANAPADFYSLLARHVLGVDRARDDDHGLLGEADIDGVMATEAGYRAMALLEVGQIAQAQQEFDQLWLLQGNNPQLRRAIELIAHQAGLRNPGRNIGNLVAPLLSLEEFPTLAPAGGFAIDPALIYALVRTESDFRSGLMSREGARGLMQIMPGTARALARLGLVAGADRRHLYDPSVNLQVGQTYLTYLESQTSIHGDLIRMLASYNAGVAGFDKLDRGIDNTVDPLLYIEELPAGETKAFVQKVLGYAWLYAEQRQETEPGIDAIAAGAFPNLPTAQP